MDDEKKRISITLKPEFREWLDTQIENRKFHNYQHGIDYCLQKAYDADHPFQHFNIYEDHVTIYDKLKDRLADVYFRGGKAYCELDESFDCEHITFALSIPKVVEPLRERGWIIREGKVVRGPT